MADEVRFGRHRDRRMPGWARRLCVLAAAGVVLAGGVGWYSSQRHTGHRAGGPSAAGHRAGASFAAGPAGPAAVAGARRGRLPPGLHIVLAGRAVGPLAADGRPGRPWFGPFGPDTWPVAMSPLPGWAGETGGAGQVLVTVAILPFGAAETYAVGPGGPPRRVAGAGSALAVVPSVSSAVVYATAREAGQRGRVRVVAAPLRGGQHGAQAHGARPRVRTLAPGSSVVADTDSGLLVARPPSQAAPPHAAAPYTLTLVSTRTGRASRYLGDASGLPVAVSPTRVAVPRGRCAGRSCRLAVITLRTGAVRDYSVPGRLSPCCGALSPDGTMLAVSYQQAAPAAPGAPAAPAGRVGVTNLSTGAVTWLSGLRPLAGEPPQLAWSRGWLVAGVPVSRSGLRDLVAWRPGSGRLTLVARNLDPGLFVISR